MTCPKCGHPATVLWNSGLCSDCELARLHSLPDPAPVIEAARKLCHYEKGRMLGTSWGGQADAFDALIAAIAAYDKEAP